MSVNIYIFQINTGIFLFYSFPLVRLLFLLLNKRCPFCNLYLMSSPIIKTVEAIQSICSTLELFMMTYIRRVKVAWGHTSFILACKFNPCHHLIIKLIEMHLLGCCWLKRHMCYSLTSMSFFSSLKKIYIHIFSMYCLTQQILPYIQFLF